MPSRGTKRLLLTIFLATQAAFLKYRRSAIMTRGWSSGKVPRGTSGTRTAPPLFDALTATAHDLQKALSDGKLKSTDLVQEYVWRTEEYNGYLHAVAQYAPGAYERAQKLDEQRASGQVIGPLHGIPVLLKVCSARSPYHISSTAYRPRIQY